MLKMPWVVFPVAPSYGNVRCRGYDVFTVYIFPVASGNGFFRKCVLKIYFRQGGEVPAVIAKVSGIWYNQMRISVNEKTSSPE